MRDFPYQPGDKVLVTKGISADSERYNGRVVKIKEITLEWYITVIDRNNIDQGSIWINEISPAFELTPLEKSIYYGYY